MKSFLAFLYICRKQEIMVYKTNRKEDTRLELIVNEFLDDYFLSKEFDATRWVVEKEEQLSGVDIYLTSEKHGLNEAKVDIKSAVKYSNCYLSTFSLELSFIGYRGGEKTGWFLNDSLETEYYLLLYPRSQKYYTDMIFKDDIDYIIYKFTLLINQYNWGKGQDFLETLADICERKTEKFREWYRQEFGEKLSPLEFITLEGNLLL